MGGVIETSYHFGGVDVDGVAETYEYVDSRRVLTGFEHADIFPRDASTRCHFLLGEAGFQSKFP
jgi:hypothetical protein